MDDILELNAVAERSAGREDGILEVDASEADAEIECGLAVVRSGRHCGGLSLEP
jgi:hypothetical protein